MFRFLRYYAYTLAIFLLAACSKEHLLDRLEHIKETGNENPKMAIAMLDSLELDTRESNEYIKAKYDLLKIRLNDKADIIPHSDIAIKKLMNYFEEEGTAAEKQEVFYYAGSVYRDLQDVPQAMSYFFRSLDYADDRYDFDSVMLRNTYSNLAYLYYRVQDYGNSAMMAKKELAIRMQLKNDLVLPYMHLGASYFGLDSLQQAYEAFNMAYSQILNSNHADAYQDALVHLVCNYSELGDTAKAGECLRRIELEPLKGTPDFLCAAFAKYYEAAGKLDSAIVYGKHILDEGTNISLRYDAAKLLFMVYGRMGDIQNTNRYAGLYMQLSDSLDFGKRQELAATVSNEFQYHLDEKKEQSLKEEKDKYRNILIVGSFVALLLLSMGYALHIRRRNRHLQEILSLSAELQRMSEHDKRLHADIAQKEEELETSRLSLERASEELNNTKQELQRVNAELNDYDKMLKAKELQLTERMDQNKTFIKLLHQSELDKKAEDVVFAIRQASTGRKNMKADDWKRLYQAVDELYPLFKDRLLKELGTFTEQQMQVCYLMRVGLSKPQIQNMTDLSRVTIWRWVKKYEWVLSPDSLA